MSREANEKLLSSLISNEEPEDTTQAQQQPAAAVTTQQQSDDDDKLLTLPKVVDRVKAPKQTAEESAAVLRKQRDEARQKAQELEEQLGKASTQGTIYDEVKKLINKDEVTPDDLKKFFDDFEFTKKEKIALEESLKTAQARLRDYDIQTSPDFQESFVKPIQLAADALTAEICPISGDDFIPVPASGQNALRALLDSGNITPATVKIALNKIKAAYEDEDVEYEMPNVRNVTEHLQSIAKGVAQKDKAIADWETEREAKKKENQDNANHKNTLLTVKSRQERKKMAQEFLEGFVKRDEFDYLADDYGSDTVMQTIVDQHSYLTDIMDDPAKAPTYDGLLEVYSKAQLFDKLIEQKKSEAKLALAKKKEARIESAGQRPSKSDGVDLSNPNLAKMKELGVI